VKRIVRATFPRFRRCYELGVDDDAKLKGTSPSRSRSTRPARCAREAGADDDAAQGVAACVLAIFGTLAFPEPEGGEVDVVLPLAFANVP